MKGLKNEHSVSSRQKMRQNVSLKQSWCFRGFLELMERDDVENCLLEVEPAWSLRLSSPLPPALFGQRERESKSLWVLLFLHFKKKFIVLGITLHFSREYGMFLLACQLKSLAPAYSKVKRLTCEYFKIF